MTEQDLFLAALDIADPAERAAYIAHTCADNPALRRQVESLLAAHDRSGEFLDVPALQQIAGRIASAGQSPTPVPADADAETRAQRDAAPGEIDLSFLEPSTTPDSIGRLGHYDVQQVIGRGACGIVLKAFDETLHRIVALKVMTPELAATSPARKRFLREARAAAAIRHDNVVSIHSVEEHPIPFLVMEHIDGQTLQQKLDGSGPLDIAEVLSIGEQIARGLEAAHATGLIHRDIKPANILLESRPVEPGEASPGVRVKISDFGLARAADDASLTQSGMIAGTPLYMSAEQARGDTIDARSDLFSLGSVLYVMCSGRPPFRASTTLAVLKRVAEDEPRPIQEIIPEVPQWLSAIIGKLHAKDPADRFGTAPEVAGLLARCRAALQNRADVSALPEIRALLAERPDVADAASVGVTQAAAAPTAAPGSVTPLPRFGGEGPGVRGPAGAPVRHPRRRWVAAAAMLLALLAGLGMTEATGVTNFRGTVVRLFSPEGTLVVEVDDPAVSVSIDGEEMVITGAGAKEIRLKPGQYKLLASKDGKLLRQELVTVTRDGRQVVRVSKEAGPVVEVSPAAAGTPTAEQRKSLEWVLSIGGIVEVKQGWQPRELHGAAGDRLPGEYFTVSGINLGGSTSVDDSSVEALRAVPPVSGYLRIGNERLSDLGLEKLAGYPALGNVVSLGLRCPRVTDRGLAHLRRFPRLRSLSLGAGPGVTDAGLVHLRETPRLTSLDLQAEKTTPACISTVAAACPNITSLILAGEWVTDDVCEPLTGLRSLQELVVGGGARVTAIGIRRLRDLPELATLAFQYCPLADADLAALKDLPALRKFVAIYGPTLTDKGLDHLGQCSSLAWVELRTPKLTKAGIEKLAAALPHCRIVWNGGMVEGRSSTGNGSNSQPTAAGDADPDRRAAEWVLRDGGSVAVRAGQPEKALWIAALKDLPAGTLKLNTISRGPVVPRRMAPTDLDYLYPLADLGGLYLGDTDLTDADLARLVQFPAAARYEGLCLRAPKVTDAGVAKVATLPKIDTLQLSGTQMTDAGLEALPAMPALRGLGLDGNPGITDAGVAKLRGLKVLYLNLDDNPQITDAGLKSLAGMNRLELLWLRGTSISDLGLTDLKAIRDLASLNISNTHVTDAGLQHLKNLVKLRALDVTKTRSTKAGVEELAAALPSCRILWDGGVIEPTKPSAVTEALPSRYTNALGMEFAVVPKGKAWLGGGGGTTGDKVVEFTDDFYLGVYEVTQDEWEKVTGSNPSAFARTGVWKSRVQEIDEEELKRFPVENVSWDDCQLFIRRLNEQAKETGWLYRLPKGTEWEYACRGGPMRDKLDGAFDYYFDKASVTLDPAQANFLHDEGLNRTCKVGSYKPNRLGLFDMHGNVVEWCDDEVKNADGVPCKADWGGGFMQDAPHCRAIGYAHPTSYRDKSLGLRLARVRVTDPERQGAEWILSRGGTLTIHARGTSSVVTAGGKLPAGPFSVERVQLWRRPGITDDDLVRLTLLPRLGYLGLGFTDVGDSGLAHLQKIPNLIQLSLAGTAISDAGMDRVKGVTKLTGLDLADTAIGDQGLGQLRSLRNLEHLDLARTRVTDAGLVQLKELTGLVGLGLVGTTIGDEGLKHLPSLRNLDNLALAETRVTDAGLEQLKGMTGLTQLGLAGTQVGDAGLVHLKDLTGLKFLDLQATRISDGGLAHLQPLTGLEALDLRRNRAVTDAGLEHLKSVTRLKSLLLGATGVTDAGLKHLAACKNLTFVTLNGEKVSEAGVKDLAAARPDLHIVWDGGEIKPMKGAAADPDRRAAEWVLSIGGKAKVKVAGRELNVEDAAQLPSEPFQLSYVHLMSNRKVDDDGLTNLRGCRHIAWLDVRDTLVTDAGLVHLKDCTSLETLWLTGNLVTDAGLVHFKECKRLANLDLVSTQITDAGLALFKDCRYLTTLSLGKTRVTDAGLAHFKDCRLLENLNLFEVAGVTDSELAHFKGCRNLKLLTLALTSIGDAGLAHFRDCTDLTRLDLRETPITDSGLQTVHRFRKLAYLDVRGAKDVTGDGVAAVQGELPECRILWAGGEIDPAKAAGVEN